MLPPFLGALLLVGTTVFVAIATIAAVIARGSRRPDLARWPLIAGGVAVAVYAGFWLLGVALAPTAVVTPGKEISFCGLDCHLHVSVREVRTNPYMTVMVHFASDAKMAPEWPGKLRFRLRSSSGGEIAPTNQVPDNPLVAGGNWDYELRFPAPATPDGSTLVVTWGGTLDYLVPGEGNSLVQRRRRLALPPAGGA